MKKLSLFAIAAAGLFFGACSSDDAVKDVVTVDDFQDGAYIGIALTLPSADNSTRANDELSNGIEEEFAVKNATLYIFKGTSEANAVFVDYVALGTKYNPDKEGPIEEDVWNIQDGVDETNITSTSLNEATKIPNELANTIKGDATNNYYAYVILNHNGQVPTLTKNSTTFQQFSRTPFAEIGADIALEQNIYSTGMLMTSAPICNVHGGTEAPSSPTYSTLVPLDKSKIFQSAAQAKAEPAACVYVERAAVKITVEQNESLTNPQLDGYNVTIDGWKVINTEKSYYNTRQINYKSTNATWTTEDWSAYKNDNATPAAALYRFVSFYQFLPTLPSGLKEGYKHTVGFRTYFAADPNYNVDATNDGAGNTTLAFTTADDSRPWIALNKHAYTTENTFDVEHQTWRNTTMVTIKASLSKTVDGVATSPSFYTVGKGSQTTYDNVADVQAVIHNLVMNDPAVSGATQKLLKLISKNNPTTTVKAGLTVDFTAPTAATTGVAYTVVPAFTITSGGTTTAATYGGAAIADNTDPLYAETDGKSEAELKAVLEAAIKSFMYSNPAETDATKLKYNDPALLSFYKDGVSYYNVKIQHFGEAETPWGGNDVVANGAGVDVKEIYFKTPHDGTISDTNYEAGQNNFLGRYGVVRDNWYKLSIDAITKIGSATPVDPSLVTPDTPDDEIENYISVHVHIVPWVLREQSVIL